jgi:hypothetical protein
MQIAKNKQYLGGIDVVRYLNAAGECFVLPKDIAAPDGIIVFRKGTKVAVRIEPQKKFMWFTKDDKRSPNYSFDSYDAIGKRLLPNIDDFFERDIKTIVKVYGSEKVEKIERGCLADVYDKVQELQKQHARSRGFSFWVGWDMDFNTPVDVQ